jgi:hypothetical protein
MTTTLSHPTPPTTYSSDRTSALGRFFGVVARPQSYRNLGYLVLGLPLGTAWFAVIVSGVSVGVSLLAVALLGIPVLLGLLYATRLFANVERSVANALLGQHLPHAPITGPGRGNLWVRLRAMVREPARGRELGYLLLRFPAGIATATFAAVALATPVLVAYAPWAARHEDQPFGDWAFSANLEDIASSSPWSWFLVPLGIVLLIPAFHLVNAVAAACGRWTAASLRVDDR